MRQNPCDPRRLDMLLNNRLSEHFQVEAEAHLMSCPNCRGALDELAGGKRWWADVQHYLADGAAANLALTSDPALPRPGAAINLDFLERSEDPNSLGRLGSYEILEILGQGGMGIVLKASEPALKRLVAIKVLAVEHALRGAARKRFAREAQAAAAVVHDHVVPVHAIDADATPPYLVMAFISGQTLQQRIDRSGPLETKEILRIGRQTAAGLAAAHAQGLVHRDIKPANIMLENGIERVRITDFGLARALDDVSVTQNGMVAGTPQYMAPEQARGETIDQRADLFALGSVLYTMATGRVPFTGDCGLTVIRHVCDVEPPPLRSLNPDVPAWLEGIVRKLHEKDPARRFQSATEVADLLEGCLAHVQDPRSHMLPDAARKLAREVGGKSRSHRWRHWWAMAGAVAAGAVVVASVFEHFRASRNTSGGNMNHLEVSAPPATLEPAELLSMETEMRDKSNKVHHQMRALEQSLQPALEVFTGSGPTLAEADLRVRLLQTALSATEPADFDPINAQMHELRRRLEILRQRAQGFSD